MNGYIYSKLEVLTNQKLVMTEKNLVSPDVAYVPDGAALIREVNKKKLSYNI